MTLLEDCPRRPCGRAVPPSSRPSGSFCARRVSRTPKPWRRSSNDRRIAENTPRIPHPYTLADAEDFIAAVNSGDGEPCSLITLDDEPIGSCGLAQLDEHGA